MRLRVHTSNACLRCGVFATERVHQLSASLVLAERLVCALAVQRVDQCSVLIGVALHQRLARTLDAAQVTFGRELPRIAELLDPVSARSEGRARPLPLPAEELPPDRAFDW